MIKDFKKIMKETERWINSGWHGTDFKYTFQNGSFIEFFSATDDSKLRGARRDILYMNEANNLSFHSYTELSSRTKEFVYLDWNPTNSFWFHEEVLGDDDVDFLIINYLDNEACPESAKNFIEKAKEKAKTSKYWENWYRVYGLGEVGVLEGVIFQNWKTIDKIPDDAILESQGLDFGFTNDPTTLMQRYRWNGKYIFHEVIYQKGLTNNEIAKLIKANDANKVVTYADSAEPKSIAELKQSGIRITGAIKGADSINIGIDNLRREDFYVTSSSLNYIKELRNYMWAVDKEGKTLNKPIDAFNHCFVGDTLITTNSGQKRIDKIEIGDFVLTSKGFKKVNKVFDNGVKKTYKYLMQFDTFFVSLVCTDSHKIKTRKEWKCIKNLMESDILYIETKSILAVGLEECTLQFGSSTMQKCQRVFMSIIKTKIRTITQLIISNLLSECNILQNTQEKDFWKIQNLLRSFKRKALVLPQSGTSPQVVQNGIQSTQSKCIKSENLLNTLAKSVVNYIQQGTLVKQDSVIQTARLVQIDVIENYEQQVYDLSIDECHEYFANGVLVHNCIDAKRYSMSDKQRPSLRNDLVR